MVGLVLTLIVAAVAALIRGVIIPAYRRSQRQAAILAAQVEVSISAPPFALAEGERVLATCVSSGLSAMRISSTSGVTEDQYLASLPLVFVTSRRLVVLMATNDDPRGIRGPLIPVTISPDRRVGEMFPAGGPGDVSAVEIEWSAVWEFSVTDPTITFSWEVGGPGTITIAIRDHAERTTFEGAVAGALRDDRIRRGLPSEPRVNREPDAVSYDYQPPTGRCGNCGTPSVSDRFCTGCGAPLETEVA